MGMYTKDGEPLEVSRSAVYAGIGHPVGRISGRTVFGTDGRYLGTILRDQLLYRSTDTKSHVLPSTFQLC